jgi:hypothetical protein
MRGRARPSGPIKSNLEFGEIDAPKSCAYCTEKEKADS